MKTNKLILLSLTLLFVSCGKKTVNKYIENPYDNSENEERLARLELKLEQTIELNIQKMEESEENEQTMQGTIDTMLVQLTELRSNDSIVEFLDPCGDMPNQYDEVLLKTQSGAVIAYFEQGSKRFLSKLEKNVHYRTTDLQACNFKLNDSGELTTL